MRLHQLLKALEELALEHDLDDEEVLFSDGLNEVSISPKLKVQGRGKHRKVVIERSYYR